MNEETPVIAPVAADPVSPDAPATTETVGPTAPATTEPVGPTAPATTDPASPITAAPSDPSDPITGAPTNGNTSNGNLIALMSPLDYSTHSTTTYNYVTTQSQTNNSNEVLGMTASNLEDPNSRSFSCGVNDGLDGELRLGSRIYRFDSRRYFRNNGKKVQIDRITNYSIADGDKLQLSRRIFKGMGEFEFESVDNRKELKNAARGDADIIYHESKGRLYFNANDQARGFGNTGGLFAILENRPDLSADQFLLS